MADLEPFKYSTPPVWEVGLSAMTAGPVLDPYDIREVHDLFRDRFPNREKQPAFAGLHAFPAPNVPGMPVFVGGMPFFGGGADNSRYWFLDESGANLTQVQEDFTARNWRKLSPVPGEGQPYPGFDALKADYRAQIDVLESWHQDHGRVMPVPTICELLYDNLIPLDSPDGSRRRPSETVRCFAGGERIVSGLSTHWFERIDGKTDSAEPLDLQIICQMVGWPLTMASPPPYIKLMFVARSAQQSWDGVYGFFDRAHDHIRMRLLELTTESAREAWGT